MQQYKALLIYGFAIFAMFFGSGNLVFPISIGLESGDNWLFGFLGLILTGILLPFLGFLVIKLYGGSYNRFFGEAGSLARFAIPLFTLSLLGSFGVIPRCITVAYSGMTFLFPDLSLFTFSLLFCIVSFFLCLKDQIIIKALGKWMSPALLIALIALIGFGILKSFYTQIEPATKMMTNAAFSHGFLTGYQTMDLFAAFFFSSFIFKQIQATGVAGTDDREIIKFAIKSGIFGSLFLGATYLGFVFLGSHYGHLIENLSPEYRLPTIVQHIMGESATIFLAIAILFSCLTTAVALNNIYARHLCSAFKWGNNKFPYILLATTSLSLLISLLDFRGIAAFLAPALEASYPALIALTVICLSTKRYKRFKMVMFWSLTFLGVLDLAIKNL